MLSKSQTAKTKSQSSHRAKVVAKILLPFSATEFRKLLQNWYRKFARRLPWRGVDDPYAIWLSEVMLQQTRVATVIDRYGEFLQRFPSLKALAAAEESEVLALWSGLGYYRRARMLLRGAQFVERELHGKMPQTAKELLALPGVGAYTAAAIASIAYGECVAVLDGNVERVLLRVLGQPEERTSKANKALMSVAQELMPRTRHGGANLAAEHNQAMMELGATVCLPRSPLCLQCPVFELCKTRGEHKTPPRTKQSRRDVAYLLAQRKSGSKTQVLLQRRAADASQMAGMLELPALALEKVHKGEPALRLRHSITTTNFDVRIYVEGTKGAATSDRLEWVSTKKLHALPLTGLARKVLLRLQVMQRQKPND